jgi:CheY-like chemotaxis protein
LLVQMLGPAVTIEQHLAPDMWPLKADPNQVELALLNLAANARDAMPDGGRLMLSARNVTAAPDGSAFLDHRPCPVSSGDYVVLTVADTGSGMDEQALARAAEPFFTTKGQGKGTGLGLSMVHGFAQQSGGALRLSSRPGAGTTVEVWLPRSSEPAAEHTPASAVQPIGAAQDGAAQDGAAQDGAKRVLLVDDDALVLSGTMAMFEALGFTDVRPASSGREALEILRRDTAFDVLMTDYMMPGMTGAELAARAVELAPALPVLLASGFADIEGLNGGEWPRLRKPYTLTDLAAAMAGLGLGPPATSVI